MNIGGSPFRTRPCPYKTIDTGPVRLPPSEIGGRDGGFRANRPMTSSGRSETFGIPPHHARNRPIVCGTRQSG